ncbi:MAG: T9SS type A sorting domain-containing protein [Algibacter sp.]|uniref:T9SS type A sorting domain-containing protein n=1 Tax=Algibacter sp. TaxID=1872428 RepID=UPI0026238CF5|nr:T9SS type A sorting domain-containing protein [Algibacter sp.]MDG1729920.1 T9SS type A sorting domain-containing protein [Algibacter sp.]MDG2178511.1 T9SS type A sorting domain-containing protein [Algibacter sp.]
MDTFSTTKNFFLIICVCIAAMFTQSSEAQSHAQSFYEYSGEQGKNNWYYGYYVEDANYETADFQTFSNFDVNLQRWLSPSLGFGNGFFVDNEKQHPIINNGTKYLSGRRWVSDTDRDISIKVKLDRFTNAGDGVIFYCYKDGSLVEEINLEPTEFIEKTIILDSVSIGENIDFLIFPKTTQSYDATSIEIEINKIFPSGFKGGLSENFSDTQKKAGWSYGYYIEDASYDAYNDFIVFNDFGDDSWSDNSVGIIPYINSNKAHPSYINNTNYITVMRWESDNIGDFKLVGDYSMIQNAGNGVKLFIYKNGIHEFEKTINSGGTGNFDFVVRNTEKGDFIDVLISSNDNSSYDGVNFDYDIYTTSAGEDIIGNSSYHYSSTQGQNNWYYGYSIGNTTYSTNDFIEFTNFNSSDNWVDNSIGNTFYTSASRLHPYILNNEEYKVINRWISDTRRNIQINWSLDRFNSAGNGIKYIIYKNGIEVISGALNAGTSTQINELIQNNNKNDIYDFVVASNGNSSYDATDFNISISEIYGENLITSSIRDFNKSQLYNGWLYGCYIDDGNYDLNEDFILFNSNKDFVKSQWESKLTDGVFYIGKERLHPNSEFVPVKRWESYYTGNAEILTQVDRYNVAGNGVNLLIYLNGHLLKKNLVESGSFETDTLKINYLKAGDVIDFMVDSNGSSSYDGTDLSIDIMKLPDNNYKILTNYSDDFSQIQESNGWEYGYYAKDNLYDPLNDFMNFPNFVNNEWRDNTIGTIPLIGKSTVHPYKNSNDHIYTVNRWKSTINGDINLFGYLDRFNESGDGVEFLVYKSGQLIHSEILSAGEQKTFDINISGVSLGDEIDLMIGANGNSSFDSTRIYCVIGGISASNGPDYLANSINDFSSAQGNNGWYYGSYDKKNYYLPSEFEMSNNYEEGEWISTTNSKITNLSLTPSNDSNAVLRWTSDNTYSELEVSLNMNRYSEYGDKVNLILLQDGAKLYDYELNPGNSVNTNIILRDLQLNSTIDLILDPSTNNFKDETEIEVNIATSSTGANSFLASSVLGFSSIQGTNQWNYGSWVSDEIYDADTEFVNSSYANGEWSSNNTMIDDYTQIPGFSNSTPIASIRRWTSNISGDLEISGNYFLDINSDDGVVLKMFKNGDEINNNFISPDSFGDISVILPNTNLGDKIDIMILPREDDFGDDLKIQLLIKESPITIYNGNIIHVEDFGALGDGVTNDLVAVKAAVEALKKLEGGTLLFEANHSYYLSNGDNKYSNDWDYVLDFENDSNLTVDGNGSNFICKLPVIPINIFESENINISNLDIFYTPLPVAYGTVSNINPSSSIFDLTIDQGYSIPELDPITAKDLSNKWSFGKPVGGNTNIPLIYIKKVEALDIGQRKVRVYSSDNQSNKLTLWQNNSQVNKFLLPNGYYAHRGNYAIKIIESDNINFDNINVNAVPQYVTLIESNVGPITFNNVELKSENPNRPFVAWRDGFHCKNNKSPLVWDNCYVSNTYDDSFNLSTFMSEVKELKSNRSLIVSFTGNGIFSRSAFLLGDSVSFMNKDTYAIEADANISQASISGKNANILLDRDITLDLQNSDYLMISNNQLNSGSIIKNSDILTQTTFKSPDFLIENCTIQAYMPFESERNREGIPSNGVTLKNNLFLPIGNGFNYSLVTYLQSPKTTTQRRHRNILFEGNTFVDKIKLEYSEDIKFYNNNFLSDAKIKLIEAGPIWLKGNKINGVLITDINDLVDLTDSSAFDSDIINYADLSNPQADCFFTSSGIQPSELCQNFEFGDYQFTSKANQLNFSSNGTNITMEQGNSNDNQIWTLVNYGDNTFFISNKDTGDYLTLVDNSTLALEEFDASERQLFRFEILADSSYVICSSFRREQVLTSNSTNGYANKRLNTTAQAYTATKISASSSKSSNIKDVVFLENDKLLLYPNPIKKGNNLTIQVKQQDEINEIEIFSLNGSRVYENSNKSSKYNSQITLPSNLRSGIYLVRIQTTGGVATKKLLLTN